jgi:hypothetical protein
MDAQTKTASIAHTVTHTKQQAHLAKNATHGMNSKQTKPVSKTQLKKQWHSL